MTYIYTALKLHLCKDIIGIIEDMVKWEGNSNWITVHKDGQDIKYYGGSLLVVGVLCESLSVGPRILYDPNFTGDKPIQLSDSFPEYAKPCTISAERYLKRGDVYVPTIYSNVMFSYPYTLFKINESCYIFDRVNGNGECLYIANNLQTLYDKYMDDNEKKAFFKLEELKE